MWRPLLHIPRVVNNGFGHKVEPRAVSIIVKKILAFHQHMNTYKPKFWRWFAVV